MRTVRLALFFVAAWLWCAPAFGLVIGDTSDPPARTPWPLPPFIANGAPFDDESDGVWPFDDDREQGRGRKRTGRRDEPRLPSEVMEFLIAGPIGPAQPGTEGDLLSNDAFRNMGVSFAPPVPEPGSLFVMGIFALGRRRRR